MSILKNGNWGLKLLALILAIVIYHSLKNESARTSNGNDRSFFQPPVAVLEDVHLPLPFPDRRPKMFAASLFLRFDPSGIAFETQRMRDVARCSPV